MAKPFYSDGLKFECQQCSHCCCDDPGFVYLSQDDLTNLCDCLNLNEEEFIKKYCRWVPYYDNTIVLCLKEKPGYDCILWDNGCLAYKARPLQCKTYPFWTYLVRDEISWMNEAKECPGINKGKIHTLIEIEKSIKEYDSIEPLRYSFSNKKGDKK